MHAAAADTRRSAWTSQCSMPPSDARSSSIAVAHDLEILRVDQHGHALALDDAAQGAADGLETRSGSTASAPADDLLGQRQASSTARRSSSLGGGGLLERAASSTACVERGQRRRQRGERLGATRGVALVARGRAHRVGLGPRLGQHVHARRRPASATGAGGGATSGSSASKSNSATMLI